MNLNAQNVMEQYDRNSTISEISIEEHGLAVVKLHQITIDMYRIV